MGILNVTPDSFFDGGTHNTIDAAIIHCEKLLEEGADIIDLGAYSSRPGAKDVSTQEEINRLLPVIDAIIKRFPDTILSIDTFRSEVAKATVEYGAAIINDIAAGDLDAKMFDTIANLQVPYIMMHMQGTPQNMQNLTNYKNITTDVCYHLSEKIAKAKALGINDIVIDPGFGFAKTTAQNYELLKHLDVITKTINLPMLVGISRKSMIYKLLEIRPEQALNGTTILNTIALEKGAHILRVHDVKEAKECVKISQYLVAQP